MLRSRNGNPLDGVDLSHIAGDSQPSAPQGQPPAGESSGAPADGQQAERTVPYDRFNEVVRARQELNGRVQELERTIQALTGIQAQRQQPPAEPEDPNMVAVRSDLFKVVPQLERLLKLAEHVDQLQQLVQTVPQLEGDQRAYWDVVAEQTLSRVYTDVAQVFGGDLTPRQRTMIHREFLNYVAGSPEATRRYHVQDPSLVTDFVRTLDQELLTPMRRRAQAPVEQRRDRAARAPQGGNTSPVVGSAQDTKKPKDADELMAAAFQGLRSFLDGAR